LSTNIPPPRSGISYNRAEAQVFIDAGIWMTGGGYTYRNNSIYGQYLADGDYPVNIRACNAINLAKKDGYYPPEAWYIAEENFYDL
jgi:hypothetical protein